ncbi:MAG: hypothetical protein ACRED4_07070 [Brevundimonas sp.]
MRTTGVLIAITLAGAACAPVDRCDATSDVAKDSALLATQQFVRDKLRAPATAQFPTNSRDPGVSLALTGPCRWTISGHVDAQNAFGAMIRSTYTLVTTVEDDGTYRLESLWIDGAPQT